MRINAANFPNLIYYYFSFYLIFVAIQEFFVPTYCVIIGIKIAVLTCKILACREIKI